ncbi:uncharacterized protein BKA78DRAFT_27262 [Phyllosticta capitalensis]|uniref:uncharacterized protein n=1 Tax=Phyllosticta capitalensis TaxID=121624 RepID=UPI0031316FB1
MQCDAEIRRCRETNRRRWARATTILPGDNEAMAREEVVVVVVASKQAPSGWKMTGQACPVERGRPQKEQGETHKILRHRRRPSLYPGLSLLLLLRLQHKSVRSWAPDSSVGGQAERRQASNGDRAERPQSLRVLLAAADEWSPDLSNINFKPP